MDNPSHPGGHVGKIADYPMSEFHKAMLLRALKEGAVDLLTSTAAKASGVGAGGYATYQALKKLLK